MSKSPETSLQSFVKSNSRAAADSVHQGIDHTAEVLHKTTENAATSATRLADSAVRGADALRITEKKARATLLSYSSEHPFRALALCLGAGYLLAKITGWKTRANESA